MSETMKLPRESIHEFKQIYKKQFGSDISEKKAGELSSKLLNLYKLVYMPVKPNENEKLYHNTK
jgi:hypothetical protein